MNMLCAYHFTDNLICMMKAGHHGGHAFKTFMSHARVLPSRVGVTRHNKKTGMYYAM